jgi:DNA-binding transcriptional ArsR family regulator
MSSELVWRAVADPTRRRLIELLRDAPQTTGDLCRAFPTTRFAVMKHLAVLERAGLVEVHRAGRTRWNVLDPEPLRALEGRWEAAAPEKALPADVRLPPAAAECPQAEVGQGSSPARPLTIQVYIDAVAWRVFDALTVNLAAWWGAPHLYAADASNLILEPQPGGRFFEEWGHRQGVLRGIVSAIRQDEHLELTGALFRPTPSALCFRLECREGGTLLTASLSRAADAPGDDDVDRGVLDDLLRTRLKAFVEHGTRSGLAS